jgi:hypothetical protein
VEVAPLDKTVKQPGKPRSAGTGSRLIVSNWDGEIQPAPGLRSPSDSSSEQPELASRGRPTITTPLFSPPRKVPRKGLIPTVIASTSSWGHLAAPEPIGCKHLAASVLQAIADAALFQIRFMHMNKAQLLALSSASSLPSSSSTLTPAAKVNEAEWLHVVLKSKVAEAARRGFDQLSFLTDDLSLPLAVRCQRIPSARFGVSVEGVFCDQISPDATAPADSLTFSSSSFIFMGSKWFLDVKRYFLTTGKEMLAVYLRRTLAGFEEVALSCGPGGAFVDERERVRLGFGIRLCGGPGSPTINSICGRSSSGKSFGIDDAQSWGWDNFLSTSKLSPQPWAQGDTLRFMVTLTPM